MIREVLSRRFKRAIQEKDNFLSFPDLVLIDGGKGQYSAARETINELGLHDIPIIAIAKGKFRNSGNEIFFHNGKGSIRKRSLLRHFGSARAVESASLDEIKSVEGVEEKVAKKIYNFFHE